MSGELRELLMDCVDEATVHLPYVMVPRETWDLLLAEHPDGDVRGLSDHGLEKLLYDAFEAGWFDNHTDIADAWVERKAELLPARGSSLAGSVPREITKDDLTPEELRPLTRADVADDLR